MPFGQRLGQSLECLSHTPLVAQFAAHQDDLAVERLSPYAIPLQLGEQPPVYQRDAQVAPIAQLLEACLTFSVKLRCPLVITLINCRQAQVAQHHRDTALIAQLAKKRQSLLMQLHSGSIIVLI